MLWRVRPSFYIGEIVEDIILDQKLLSQIGFTEENIGDINEYDMIGKTLGE